MKRIQRLLSQPEAPRNAFAPILPVGILVVTGAVGLAAWQAPTVSLPFVRLAQAQTSAAAPVAESAYDRWLQEEAVYIITDRERIEFKKLQTDDERKHFIEHFWERRDPTPGTPKNEYRDEHYRRIAYANDRFVTHSGLPGWKTDRGRIYIQYGPPDEIDSHPSGGTYTRPPEEGGAQTVTYPFEQWRYRFIEGIGNNVILEFVDKEKTGEYRLTMDPSEKEVPPSKPPEPKLSYKGLEPFIQAGSTVYNGLPMKVRVSYAPLTSSAMLVQITVQFDTKDLYFQDKDNVSTATINIYGRIVTLERRPLLPFEEVVSVAEPTQTLSKLIEANPPQIYQKTLILQPGRYRLDIAAKDLGSKSTSAYQKILDVPEGVPQ